MVEGYMDVVTLSMNGFNNAIAPLGTAVNSIQISNALRYTDHLTFCFDMDRAGSVATLEAICRSLDVTDIAQVLDVVSMPDRYDPDLYIREFGKGAFSKLLSDALPADQWLANYALRTSIESRRTSRSNGKRDIHVEINSPEVGTRAKAGSYINDICSTIESDAIKKQFISSVESLIGTKL